ncbi:MAG: response regulator [Ferruginibacter sp.]
MKRQLNCVMMIDDDEPTNYFNSILFEAANCTRHLEIIDGGKKALDYLQNAETGQNNFVLPDLVFLDINMPGMNGWEFLEEYEKLAHSGHRKPVIIMLSTSQSSNDTKKANSNPQIDGFENKPLTIGMIDRIIGRYFNIAG